MSLDGIPKLALATAAPLWRDLTPETRGEDVRALQDELNRLGFQLTSDGVMGKRTFAAAKSALARIGVTLQPGGVPAASFIWIPAATVAISSCDASIGAEVQKGAALAAFTSMSPKVTITDLPTDLLRGSRIVKAGNAHFPADPNGDVHVSDVAALGVHATSDSSDANAPIPAQLVLADPIAVSVVPPSAVYDLQGTDGCVASKGVPYRVHILGSQLGETLVEFVKALAPARVDVSPERHPSCR
ncbi:peptidoglycan-binding protein [Diaminobutyricibacter tongyongensis]|uniref:Peptidoglycan-binding protein n=1 Tax=Leifsonia tongyongensis TaxID=1268043 RepID=A0A6L9XWJ1_9MICO|nr:peptidoglycan-binding domain-containing protein [Diaminobutyricibacter tongyongensis]NEN05378.1 peptidoglycan-binding protein [Diaminobutyricibacter tongyongensis]